jgi:hypothetical protein
MVDRKKIERYLYLNFFTEGDVDINRITGAVVVVGDVIAKRNISKLEVKFGSVSGTFDISSTGLESLEGCPKIVGGNFLCFANFLISLVGGPSKVGGNFVASNNSLKTLEGAPDHVGGYFEVDYSHSLPLLRLLQYNHIHVANAPKVVTQILNKYAGTGKKGMLGAGLELTRAGFKENARW